MKVGSNKSKDRASVSNMIEIGLVRNFLRFFRKFPGTAENVPEYFILGVYEYCSNDNKIIPMEVDLELEMK